MSHAKCSHHRGKKEDIRELCKVLDLCIILTAVMVTWV